ncbi:MAG: MMPL family transporter [Actinomycetota bacterium]
MFDRLGRLATRRFVWVILIWIALAGVVRSVAPSLRDVATYDETAFLTADAESVRAAQALVDGWPEDEFGNSAAIVFSRTPKLTDTDLRYLEELETWLRSDAAPDVVRGTQSVKTRPELTDVLSAEDGTTTLMIVQFRTPPFEPPTNDAVVEIREHIDETVPEGLAVHVTGNAGVAADQSNSIRESIDRTTVITLVLVILILLWVYRSPVTPVVPLITIGIALLVSQGVIALLAQAGMRVSSLVETFMVVIIFGAGTDYCLFLISRFREEVGRSHEYRATLAATVAVVGGVIASSAGTVIVGFTAQGVAKFGMFRTVGPAMAIAVIITLVAGLTLTPALIRAYGGKLFWPAHPEQLAAAGALPELQVSEALGIAPTFAELEQRREAQAAAPAPPPELQPVPDVPSVRLIDPDIAPLAAPVRRTPKRPAAKRVTKPKKTVAKRATKPKKTAAKAKRPARRAGPQRRRSR